MKKLILLPFLFLLMAAQCQEPDLHGFTTEYVDSLQAIIDYQDSIINVGFNYYEARQDTFLYTIRGITDSLSVEVNKESRNIWITLIDGAKRTHLDLFNNKRTITLAEENATVGLWRPE
jgi:hypothetical protein